MGSKEIFFLNLEKMVIGTSHKSELLPRLLKKMHLCSSPWHDKQTIDPFNVICGKAVKSVSFVLYKFSQIVNID